MFQVASLIVAACALALANNVAANAMAARDTVLMAHQPLRCSSLIAPYWIAHSHSNCRATRAFFPDEGRLPLNTHTPMRNGHNGAVVGGLVAGGDQQRAEADHLREAVLDPLRRPRVLDAARQALGNVEPALDLGEHQNAAVRSQTTGIERHLYGLAADR